MTQFASEVFTGLTAGQNIQSQSANFVQHPLSTSGYYVSGDSGVKTIYNNASTTSIVLHTAVPPSADYAVKSSLMWRSTGSALYTGVVGRADPSANTMYIGRHSGTSGWQIYKSVTGTVTQLGSSVAESFTSGTKEIKLVMEGTIISLFNEGEATPVISVTDSSITAAGHAGLRAGGFGCALNTGIHVLNFSAETLGSSATTHATTGVLAATAATISGASARSGSFITHGTNGNLSAAAASASGASSCASASVTHATTGSAAASSAAVSATAYRYAAGQITTDILANNTMTPLANTVVVWSWLPIGRIGSLSAITPVDGTGTTGSDGRLTVSGLAAGAGILLVAKQNSGATDDDVFYQAGTVA